MRLFVSNDQVIRHFAGAHLYLSYIATECFSN